MKELLSDSRYDFVSDGDKAFITAFDEAMNGLGYDCGNEIRPGYCWGRHMLVYTRTGMKSKNVVCRLYIRDGDVCVRLFLNNVDARRGYVESLPQALKAPFTDGHGRCNRCKDDCAFRKAYTIDGERIEKCSGVTFEFQDTALDAIPGYMGLINEFYPMKRRK